MLKKKLCKCFILDFQPFLTAFFMIIGYFLLIYTNRTISRAPLLTERCGLRFKGAGRMWKGTKTLGETLDEGDPLGASRKVSK